MRIMTRKLWRAFSELDRYSDEQCSRFLIAAEGGGVRSFTRWCFAQALSGILWLSIGIATWELLYGKDLSGPPVIVGWFLLLLWGVAYATSVLLIRDVLLRRRVRWILRARARCAGCNYLLLGTLVTNRTHVICPECGLEGTVDRSLAELVLDDQGHEVFRPASHGGIASSTRAIRVKRWMKRVPLAVLLILGAFIGLFEIHLRFQAKRAQVLQAQVLTEFYSFSERIQPRHDDLDPEGWSLLMDAADRVTAATREFDSKNEPPIFSGRPLKADFSMIGEPINPQWTESEKTEFTASSLRARDLVEHYRALGVFNSFDQIVGAKYIVSNRTPTLAASATGDLEMIRNIARINGARMTMALESNDEDEFMRALECNLAIARLCEMQPTAIDHLVANAIESLTYSKCRRVLSEWQTEQLTVEISNALKRQYRHKDSSIVFDGELLTCKFELSMLFRNIIAIRKASALSLFGWFMPGEDPDAPFFIGTLDQNIRAIDDYLNVASVHSAKEFYERPDLGHELEMHLDHLYFVSIIAPPVQKILRSQDQIELERRGMRIILALEKFRLSNGRYPATLDDLVPNELQELPIDNFSGAAFGYRMVDPTSDPYGRGFILYSIGNDRHDDGGLNQQGEPKRDYEALTPKLPGKPQDFIINDPEN